MAISISAPFELKSPATLDSRSVAESLDAFNSAYPAGSYTAGQVTYFTDSKELKVYTGDSWQTIQSGDLATDCSLKVGSDGVLKVNIDGGTLKCDSATPLHVAGINVIPSADALYPVCVASTTHSSAATYTNPYLSMSSSGVLTAAKGLSVTSGGLVVSSGDIKTTSGSISSGGNLSANGSISTVSGGISTAAGSISAGGSITAGTTITAGGEIKGASFDTSSDARLKENLEPLERAGGLLDMPLYEFDYKNSGRHSMGCLAQDLQKIAPELVSEGEDGYLQVKESKLVYYLMLEVKELRDRLAKLEKGE